MKHLYWLKFRRNGGLPVRFPAMPKGSRRFRWTGLYRVQIGDWFIGAVKGRVDPLPTPPPPSLLTSRREAKRRE